MIGFFMRLVRLGVTIAVVCALTMFLTWTAVQTYVDRLLAAYHLNTPEQKLEFSDFLSSLAQSLNTLTGKEVAPQQQADVRNQQADTGGTAAGSVPSTVPSGGAQTAPSGSAASTAGPATSASASQPPSNTATAPTPDDAVPVLGRSTGAETDSGVQKEDVLLSAKDLNKKKEEISSADKTKIFAILSESLPTDQVQHISALVEDGITAEEMTEIQAIFQKHLKPDEIKQLTEILKRY